MSMDGRRLFSVFWLFFEEEEQLYFLFFAYVATECLNLGENDQKLKSLEFNLVEILIVDVWQKIVLIILTFLRGRRAVVFPVFCFCYFCGLHPFAYIGRFDLTIS